MKISLELCFRLRKQGLLLPKTDKVEFETPRLKEIADSMRTLHQQLAELDKELNTLYYKVKGTS